MTYQNQSGFLSNIPTVTKNLIIINILCWIASLTLPRAGIDLIKWLGLHFPGTSNFNPFQFATYMFMHDTRSFLHLFFNMFAVYMFGRVLESVWGSRRFLVFYFVAGIGAAIVQELVCFVRILPLIQQLPADAVDLVRNEGAAILNRGMNYTDPLMGALNQWINSVTIGASGAVFGILLAFGMLFPNAPLYFMFIPIPVKAKYFVIGYGVMELFLGVSGGDNVAHFAHLGGMLFGFFMIRYWKKKDRDNGRYFY
ncbi:MAG: rhomboid family intramembrane serine protease [Tannerella sp.]|jgi:membrane associated rhomboid family serine protease|nr:rhomboid family intramembrane serine protease [Tannerella sp.]